MVKKSITILTVGVFLIVGLLSYQFIIVPIMASIKKATIEKYSDCITEGLRERVVKNKIIKWIGSTDDQFEDIKVCDECRKKLGIPETREWWEVGDKVRYEYYNR